MYLYIINLIKYIKMRNTRQIRMIANETITVWFKQTSNPNLGQYLVIYPNENGAILSENEIKWYDDESEMYKSIDLSIITKIEF